MSTRSTIAVVKEDGSVISSYCHYDGYIEEGVGEALFNNFKTLNDAQRLVEGGNLRSVIEIDGNLIVDYFKGERGEKWRNEVDYFKGERGEKWRNVVDFFQKYGPHSYTYIFEDGEWYVTNHSSSKHMDKLKTYFK